MENLKIRVANEAESKEAQELFFELGCYWNIGLEVRNLYAKFLYVSNNQIKMGYCSDNFSNTNYREITLAELRDMVVLNRNDVNDATHKDTITGDKVLQLSDKIYYWQGEKWNEYPCGVDIKPIEKKEMKEYLSKNSSGNYQLVNHRFSEDDIEVPDGAEVATASGLAIYFWKPSENKTFVDNVGWSECDTKSICTLDSYLEDGDASIIWKRHTQPEELPFMDSLNDQYAEIEQVRKHRHYFKDVSNIAEIDVYAVLKLFDVTDPCLQHIVKKALCAGKRGHKDMMEDLQNIIDTAIRAVELNS